MLKKNRQGTFDFMYVCIFVDYAEHIKKIHHALGYIETEQTVKV